MSTHEQPQAPAEKDSLLYGHATDEPLAGHSYDGIREYDNPMPAWWVWLFVATIVFSVVYYAGITFFDFVDTYEDDLAQSQEELAAIRHAYAEASPAFVVDEAALAGYMDDPAMVAGGAETYGALCAACHNTEGQGLIGPNLTDDYWLHGGSNVAVFDVITKGVADKGMPAWESTLSPEDRVELVAFIRSLRGTNPPNAKEPQGELVQ